MDGRTIPDPGFAGDHGEPGRALGAALAAYAAGTGSQVDALAAVRESRLLVPVVAVLGEVEVDERGLAHDKTSDMATVLLQGADGRMALLAFSGLPALQAWDPDGPAGARDGADRRPGGAAGRGRRDRGRRGRPGGVRGRGTGPRGPGARLDAGPRGRAFRLGLPWGIGTRA